MSEPLIIKTIQRAGKAYNLSPADMVKLQKAGVSESILQAMLDPSAPSPQPQPPPQEIAAPVPAAEPEPASSSGSSLPGDPVKKRRGLLSPVGDMVKRTAGNAKDRLGQGAKNTVESTGRTVDSAVANTVQSTQEKADAKVNNTASAAQARADSGVNRALGQPAAPGTTGTPAPSSTGSQSSGVAAGPAPAPPAPANRAAQTNSKEPTAQQTAEFPALLEQEAKWAVGFCESTVMPGQFHDCACVASQTRAARQQQGASSVYMNSSPRFNKGRPYLTPDYTILLQSTNISSCVSRAKITKYANERAAGALGAGASQAARDCVASALNGTFQGKSVTSIVVVDGYVRNALLACKGR
jgi:hypothetical protein